VTGESEAVIIRAIRPVPDPDRLRFGAVEDVAGGDL
jgi:hypothetical protein